MMKATDNFIELTASNCEKINKHWRARKKFMTFYCHGGDDSVDIGSFASGQELYDAITDYCHKYNCKVQDVELEANGYDDEILHTYSLEEPKKLDGNGDYYELFDDNNNSLVSYGSGNLRDIKRRAKADLQERGLKSGFIEITDIDGDIKDTIDIALDGLNGTKNVIREAKGNGYRIKFVPYTLPSGEKNYQTKVYKGNKLVDVTEALESYREAFIVFTEVCEAHDVDWESSLDGVADEQFNQYLKEIARYYVPYSWSTSDKIYLPDTNLVFGKVKRIASHLSTEQTRQMLDFLRDKENEIYSKFKRHIFTDRHSVWKLADYTAKVEQQNEEIASRKDVMLEFENCNVELSYTDDRLRIIFPGMPSYEQRSNLKHAGFRWSPSNSAWQRQLTDNAIRSVVSDYGNKFESFLSAEEKDKIFKAFRNPEHKEDEPKPQPEQPQPTPQPVETSNEIEPKFKVGDYVENFSATHDWLARKTDDAYVEKIIKIEYPIYYTERWSLNDHGKLRGHFGVDMQDYYRKIDKPDWIDNPTPQPVETSNEIEEIHTETTVLNYYKGLLIVKEINVYKSYNKYRRIYEAFTLESVVKYIDEHISELAKTEKDGFYDKPDTITVKRKSQPQAPQSTIDFARELSGQYDKGEKYDWPRAQKLAEQMNVKATQQELMQACELAVVFSARRIAHKDASLAERFASMRDLYDQQVTIRPLDTQSKFLQQYSTPCPLAFLMGEYIRQHIDNNNLAYNIFEPTAGNGMLTIAFYPTEVTVNELDEIRYGNLQSQSFDKVTNQDATQSTEPNNTYSGVITNPPFAKLKESEYLTRHGWKMQALDYKLAVLALDKMQDNGRSAIIVGGKMFDEYWKPVSDHSDKRTLFGKWKLFLGYLYAQYNVEDVIYINGKNIYYKQGTQYPIVLILINGRHTYDETNKPHYVFNEEDDAIIDNFDILYQRMLPHIIGEGTPAEPQADNDRERRLRLAKARAKAMIMLQEQRNRETKATLNGLDARHSALGTDKGKLERT